MFIKRKLRNALNYYRFHIPMLAWILDTFETNNYEYAVVGGFVKDIIAYDIDCKHNSSDSRDIDIIVNIPRAELDYILNYYHIKRYKNDFGGYKLIDRFDATFNIDIDIWCLEDHQPFKVLSKKNPKWKDIRESGWLNVCGAIYLPQTNKLYAKGLRKALRTKRIEMYNPEIFHFSPKVTNKYTIVAKIIDYLHKGYTIDEHCKAALGAYFYKHDSYKTLVKYLEEHSKDSYIDWEDYITTKLRSCGKFQL